MKINQRVLILIAVIEGYLVMHIELTGSVLLSYYYGSSLVPMSMVLSFTLTGLAIGYYAGGHYTNYKYNIKAVFYCFLSALFLILMITPKMITFFEKTFPKADYLHVLAWESFLIILIPCFILGMTGPLAIHEIKTDVKRVGESAGVFYCFSSIGGILSAFLQGFLFIPEMGATNTIIYTGIILLVGLIILLIYYKLPLKYLAIPSLFCILLFTFYKNKTIHKTNINIIKTSDGLIGQIMILDNMEKNARTLFVNNVPQTRMHFTGRSLYPYVYYLAAFSSEKPAGSHVLVAGIGGGNLINELKDLDFFVDAVDIDARIAHVASGYFNMNNETSVFVDDVRHFINVTDKKYDIIIFDLSSGETVPEDIFTLEAFKKTKTLLKENGLFMLHYFSSLDEKNLSGINAIGNTLTASGFNCKLLNTNPKKEIYGPIIFYCSNKINKVKPGTLRIDKEITDNLSISLDDAVFLNYHFGISEILTDDKPVIGYYHRHVIKEMRQRARETTVFPLIYSGVTGR